MRLADGPSVEVETRIAAPVEVVWALACDVDLPGRFSDEFQGAEWLDGATGPALGARFRGRNAHPVIGEWQTTSTVTEYEEGRRFGWAVSDVDRPASSWRFELDADGTGTRLRQWARLGPGPSGISYEIDLCPDDEEQIVERRLAEHRVNMQRTVDGMKAMAEAAVNGGRRPPARGPGRAPGRG
jgi:hypothetical protein